MNEMTVEQNKEEPLIDEISDEILETAACTNGEKVSNFTLWLCTALYFCPGPWRVGCLSLVMSAFGVKADTRWF